MNWENKCNERFLQLVNVCKNCTENEISAYYNTCMEKIVTLRQVKRREDEYKKLYTRLNSFRVNLQDEGVEPRTPQANSCSNCGSKDIYYNTQLSSIACRVCGSVTYMENASIVGCDEESVHLFYSYKRINHFLGCLKVFAGEDIVHIPSSVVSDIQTYLHEPTVDKVKVYLRNKHKTLENYYVRVFALVLNKPIPLLSEAQVTQLTSLFSELQEPFEKVKPKGRSNFLSYPYVAYKLIEKIGLIDFLPYICLLKSTQKIQQQEQLFELICKELNWKFVPMKK